MMSLDVSTETSFCICLAGQELERRAKQMGLAVPSSP